MPRRSTSSPATRSSSAAEYEWSTVPHAALDNTNGKGVVGMCVPNPVTAPVNRVQHREQG